VQHQKSRPLAADLVISGLGLFLTGAASIISTIAVVIPSNIIRPTDCTEGSLYTDLEWYSSAWTLNPDRGLCSSYHIADYNGTRYYIDTANAVQEFVLQLDINYCVSYDQYDNQWRLIDTANRDAGLDTDLESNVRTATASTGFYAGGIVAVWMAYSCLWYLVLVLQAPYFTWYKYGRMTLVVCIAMVFFYLIACICWVVGLVILRGLEQYDSITWSTAFFTGCTVDIQAETGRHFQIFAAVYSAAMVSASLIVLWLCKRYLNESEEQRLRLSYGAPEEDGQQGLMDEGLEMR
jgi:hypothetical protein